MSDPWTLFRWTVPVRGVRYIGDAAVFDTKRGEWQGPVQALIAQEPEPFVSDVDARELRAERRRAWPEYFPLEVAPPLFEALATAPIDDGAALAAVASQWGLLGLSLPLIATASGQRSGRDFNHPLEPVAAWREELLALRDAFDLLGRVSAVASAQARSHKGQLAEARAALAERIELDHRNGGFVLLRRPLLGRATWIETGTDAHADLLRTGRRALREILDHELGKRAKLGVVEHEDLGALRLHAVPRSLIGAAWLQLAEAATGKQKVRRCLRCPNWFVVKSSRRGHDRYCSPACRQAHQRRRGEARQLADDGKSARSIADAIGAPLWLVKEWLEDSGAATNRARKQRRKE